MGEYGIGFFNTVIYNADVRFDFLPVEGPSYSQYDYKGPTPLFLQIWHPIEQMNLKHMMFKDFRNRNLEYELQSVYEPLIAKMDSFFIQYNIIEDFTDYDSIDYNGVSYFQVLDTLKTFLTRSQFKKIHDKLEFPVIVYHHGGQGLSDENFILAEYFASRGYIVVTSNFHLPFENKVYGYEGIEFDDTTLPKSVIQFAKTLTTNDQLFFIGHSAGAQVGFKFLHENNWANAFVSLETTLEGKPVDYLKSEDGWPELFDTIDRHKLDYSIPILMLANTQEDKPFPLFDELSNSSLIQVSQKELFGHESYTAGYLMRYLYKDMFDQPDTSELRTQIIQYNKQLNLYAAFLESVRNKKPFNQKEFEQDFIIINLN
ncbi:alpha/beta hydrolase family protein [Flexithrix dorotheae]|uniref:alpha/beta hydrolase family protein n=1 Tax=Flexithrix dorotheae TaxID=70993 RepID=UPI0012F71B85|nr:hypothetical protein [Flexithrix dorotheae]